MADAITELTATWVASTGSSAAQTTAGVQLNWTAAADVTTGSVYDIYVLQNTNQTIPSWVLANSLSANIVQNVGQSGYSLSNPATSYFYQFPNPTNFNIGTYEWVNNNGVLAQVGPNPTSLSFSIVHVDDTASDSDPLNISVFAPAINPVDGPPHFPNTFSLDAFGQFTVNPQDSYEEISSSVAMVVGALVGERSMLPDFGIEDPTFTEIDTIGIIRHC